MVYENIIVERKDSIGIITLNRPKALNALSADLTRELEAALRDLDNDDAACWKIPSKESTTFVGWNPMCIPTMDYIVWKLKRREQIAKGEIH